MGHGRTARSRGECLTAARLEALLIMVPPQRHFHSRSPADTLRLGAELGRRLPAGSFVGLRGDLGSGKTTFCHGLAIGLGVHDPAAVHSPSFTLVNLYEGPVPLAHLDLYRLSGGDELETIGWRDLFDDLTVIVVEWVEKMLDAVPPSWLEVTLSFGEGDERHIRYALHGSASPAWLPPAEQ